MAKHAFSKESDECTEKCQVHKKEVIKFFCPKHEALGCNDCIVLNHRACDIDYIHKKCAEIYDRLDQLQKQIRTEADKKKSTDKQAVKKVLETYTTTSSDIKQLQSRLQDYKASQQNGQLYITMKQTKSKLKSDEIKEADRSLEKTNMQYTFEQNQDLKNMLSRQDVFGKLSLSSSCNFKGRKPINKLTRKENIKVKTKSDRKECCITGCVVLSSNKLLAADYYNGKLKVVDIKNKAIREETTLSSKSWDIAVMPQDHIAVTMPDKKEILIMTGRKFPVKGECKDTQGNVPNTIKLDDKIFSIPFSLLLSKDLRHIFISDYGSDSVFSITLQGDISADYKNKDYISPMGMMMLDDGSLL
ncbi:uncharacterized protein LOC128553740, partial [Mercenaria mercenaria]|uniref:uncharacterized protein LOC128553740 n=1 Tax=Mercenaria mercenaria TaxID=6596 RepID=UPI00234E4AE9